MPIEHISNRDYLAYHRENNLEKHKITKNHKKINFFRDTDKF